MMKRGRKVQYKDDDHKERRLYAREWRKANLGKNRKYQREYQRRYRNAANEPV